MNSIDDQKTKRASREQLEYFIEFVRRNPDLLANKNDPTNPQRVKSLWSQLSEGLNAMGGPVRPATKWKETLTHWKHSLRSRARKLKAEHLLTRGGPPTEKKFKEYEERALECFGQIVVDGLADLPTLGLGISVISDTDHVSPTPSKHESDFDDLVEEFLLPSSSKTVISPLKSQAKSLKTNKNESTETLLQSVTKIMDEKDKRDAVMFQELLNVQNLLAGVIKALGDSVRYLADSISQHNSSKAKDHNDSFSSNDS